MKKLTPDYIVGLIDGEGSFCIQFHNHSQMKHKIQIMLRFNINMDIREKQLFKALPKFFKCGRVYKTKNDTMINYSIDRFSDNISVVIPFFNEYSLRTEKKKDFILWKKVAKLMSKKEHLTLVGIKKIRKIWKEAHKYGLDR